MKTPTKWLEWIVIALAIWIYCLPFLHFGSTYNLPGSEVTYFQAFDKLLEMSLKEDGQFPLWNPYFSTGKPYLAHPMVHALNPFVSVPVMLFGFMDGFKIAVFLGFLIAGLGMWWLGRELWLPAVGRVWVSLMFAFCGVPAAKFIQGHYLMVIAFGWLPFSLAALLATLRTRQTRYLGLAASGIALLIFSGNGYYAYYMLYLVGFLALFWIFTPTRKPFRLEIHREHGKIIGLVCLLALGLSAIQLLPFMDYRQHYLKPVNPELTDSQSLSNAFWDFVSPDPFQPGRYSDSLRPEEFFAYLGWWPFIGMLFLPLTWKQNRRPILFFLTLILFTLAWIDIKDMPWRGLFQTILFLAQFRYPSRMVVVGALALIALGGLGLSGLWRWSQQVNPAWLRHLSSGLVVLFLLGATLDLARVNRPLLERPPVSEAQAPQLKSQAEVLAWLRAFDPKIYFVNLPGGWNQAALSYRFHYLNAWEVILSTSRIEPQISARLIEPEAKYEILPSEATAPSRMTLLKSFKTVDVYESPNSLPYAFTVDRATLTAEVPDHLRAEEVTPVTHLTVALNEMSVNLTSQVDGALIILCTYDHDWQLTIDGLSAKVYNASGFIAAPLQQGTHQYHFVYRPFWLYLGAGFSALSILIVLGFFVAKLHTKHS